MKVIDLIQLLMAQPAGDTISICFHTSNGGLAAGNVDCLGNDGDGFVFLECTTDDPLSVDIPKKPRKSKSKK